MPPEQPFRRERLPEIPGGIEHHFDNSFDATIHDIDAGYGNA
jgi:hypothetical protein